MPDAPVQYDLASLRPDAGWIDLTMPESNLGVALLRLHVDAGSGASLSLVRFPPGWRRPAAGHYLVGEEFVLLSGALLVSGVRHRPGDLVYLPAGTVRTDSSAPDGAVAVAWFAGPARWRSGPAEAVPELPVGRHGPATVGAHRPALPDVPGDSTVLAVGPAASAPVDTDLLSLSSYAWAFVPAGSVPPELPGPVLVRTWS